jgi:hypothetical protein
MHLRGVLHSKQLKGHDSHLGMNKKVFTNFGHETLEIHVNKLLLTTIAVLSNIPTDFNYFSLAGIRILFRLEICKRKAIYIISF